MRDAVVSGGHDASQRQRNGRQQGRKSLFCAHFANDGTVRPGRVRDFRPCATTRPGVSAAVMTERLYGATVPSRTGRSWRGRGHGAVHSAGCELTDADAASRGSGGSIARSGSSTGSRRRRRSSTEPSALGRHPSIVDVP